MTSRVAHVAVKATPSFQRNFVAQVSTSAFALCLNLGLTPLMTRIFAPSEYGLFAIVNGCAVFLATLLQLSMPSMIPLARTESEFSRTVRVSTYLGCVSVAIAGLIALGWVTADAFRKNVIDTQSLTAIALLPVLVASISMQRISQNIAVYRQQFHLLGVSRILHPLLSKPLAIVVGAMAQASAYLIILAEAFGNAVQYWFLLKSEGFQFLRVGRFWSIRRFRLTFEVARRASHFSVYDNLNNILILGFSTFLLVLVSWTFSVTQTGIFTLAFSIVNLPIQLFSLGTASLVYSRLIQAFAKKDENYVSIVFKLIAGYSALGLIPFVVIFHYGPELFVLAFGDAWRDSGQIASSLAVPSFLLFVFTPVQAVYRLTNSTRAGLVIDSLFTLIIVAVIVVSSLARDLELLVTALATSFAVQRLVQLVAVVWLSAAYSPSKTLDAG